MKRRQRKKLKEILQNDQRRTMMEEKLTTILRSYVKNNKPIFRNAALVADLGLDSIDVFSLVARIEDEFNVEVSERVISELVVVQDIIDYLDKNV